MSNKNQNHAPAGMILCAGHGTRMRPLSLTTPKPLIKVYGKRLVEYGIEQLETMGSQTIVVNAHYLADQIFEWANSWPNSNIKVSDERDALLDTGGGVANALNLLGDDPFFVFNSDAFWIDGPNSFTMETMRTKFNTLKLDFLLLLAKHENAVGFDGAGDFFCTQEAQLTRRGQAESAPYIYAGCYMVHPRVFKNCPAGAFSMNELWNLAINSGRIGGHIHDGLWLHVGTPQAIYDAEAAIEMFMRNQQ